MRRCVFFLMAFVVVSTGFAQNEWVPGEVLVQLRAPALMNASGNGYAVTEAEVSELTRVGCERIEPVFCSVNRECGDLDRWMLLHCRPGTTELALLDAVQNLPNVEYASLNYLMFTDEIPNDPDYNKQYHWPLIHAEEAWSVIHGTSSVTVAIIDSGTDMDHEDLAANIWTNSGEIPGNSIDDDGNGYIDDVSGWDFANDDNNPDNVNVDNDHGTHVAGIVSAVSGNGIGVAGGSWNCPIMILKVFPNNGGGASVGDVVEAIRYATDMGARVINLSLGNNQYTDIQAQAVLYAYNAGVVVVCAAGNGGSDGIGDSTPHYPSAHVGAIGVGSSNRFNEKDGSSNYGEEYVDVFAPGVAIRSTLPGNAYGNLSGTSMASPVAAAFAALILSKTPTLTPDEVQLLMQAGCECIDESNPAYRGQLDPGRINFYNSLADSPIVRLFDWTVDDSTGNENFGADQGETINLSVTLKNHNGTIVAFDTNITLSSPAGVSWIDNTASVGTISAGDTKANQDPLVFTVTSATDQVIPMTVQVTSTGYADTFSFDLPINQQFPSMPGFPVPAWGGYNASPRVADLNGDDLLEIITASNDGTINVICHDGSNYPGWPINLMGIQYIDSMLILAAPAVADLNLDGIPEIIVAEQFSDAEWMNPNDPSLGQNLRHQGRVHVFNRDGSVFPGNWPFVTQVEFRPAGGEVIQAGFKAGPAIADVAGDAHPEIIVGNYGNHVFVLDTAGTMLSGWPRNVGMDIFATAAAFDWDQDGKCEIVIATKDDVEPLDSGTIHMFQGDGTECPGFPVAWDNQVYSAPVLADFNGDLIPEIIFGWGDYANTIGTKGLMVMNMRSEPLTGWPVSIPDTIYGSPGIGDLDGNGDLEVVVCSMTADVYAFHHDGNPVTGFPVSASSDPDAAINSSPAIADINNDGQAEIVYCMEIGFHESAELHVLQSNGHHLVGSPIALMSTGFSSPCIADIDGNGHLEIIVTDTATSVFTMAHEFDPANQYWTTYHGNNASTGLYGSESPMSSGVNLMITDPVFSGGEAFVLDAILV
ncbi:S8 family serine peptidase, partial [bacterium]|nr:S8 family serine peptidase [candidate division CSSED10-310 bacterium]